MTKRKGIWCPRHPGTPLIRTALENGKIDLRCPDCAPRSRKSLRKLRVYRRGSDNVLMVEIGSHSSMTADIAINFAMVTREEITLAEATMDLA